MHTPRLVIVKLISLFILFIFLTAMIFFGKNYFLQLLPEEMQNNLVGISTAIGISVPIISVIARLIGLDLKETVTHKKIYPDLLNINEQYIQRNRQELMKKINVELDQSLARREQIDIGMVELVEVVERPEKALEIVPETQNSSPLAGEKINDVFREMNQAILLLGEPGSGKTTTLFKLAREANILARRSKKNPVPVIFNLSSWTSKKKIPSLLLQLFQIFFKIEIDVTEYKTFTEWLVNEYKDKYELNERIFRNWIENEELLLLLDGLDEVKLEHREACVMAINDFRKDHRITPIAICSRLKKYNVLTTKLNLKRILLQPLKPEQINRFLEKEGKELTGLRKTLKNNPSLIELAKSPLMLSLMTEIFRGGTFTFKSTNGDVDSLKDHIFDAYVERMFERENLNAVNSKEQTIRWLSLLAKKMTEYPQQRIAIQNIPIKWLSTFRQLALYYTFVSIITFLILGLIAGIILGLGIGLVEDPAFGLIIGSSAGVGTGVIYGLYFSSILLVGLMIGFIRLKGVLSSFTLLETETFGDIQGTGIPFIKFLIIWITVSFFLSIGLYVEIWNASFLTLWLFVGLLYLMILTTETTGQHAIQNFCLRLVLYISGVIPRDLRKLLEYASKRTLLVKSGNGYAFFHPLLKDYFSRLPS